MFCVWTIKNSCSSDRRSKSTWTNVSLLGKRKRSLARISFNSNVASSSAQRWLTKHTSSLHSTFDHLSSGLRITKPSDDAAGLAIAESLQTDSTVFRQGVRNINDGVSLLNIADGALGEMSNIIIRIRELAEQGANGTLGRQQRTALQGEVTALQAEYNRLRDSTEFNDVQLLTGADTQATLQGGYGSNGQLVVQIGDSAMTGAPSYAAGETILASRTTAGGLINSDAYYATISADGRYTAFASWASNIVSGDTNGTGDIFVWDNELGSISRVSVSTAGAQGNGEANRPVLSSDGRYVVFQSDATNVVAGDSGFTDIFIRDLQSGTTRRVSETSVGGQANGNSTFASISADGRYIAFQSSATNLVSGDSNGADDIFVKDLLTGGVTRVSTSSSGAQSNGNSSAAKISADGRFVAFETMSSNLAGTDTNGAADILLKDLTTGQTTLISASSSGTIGNFGSAQPKITADGRYISFWSYADNLVAGDSGGFSDAFVKDTITGAIQRVSLNMAGTSANGDVLNTDISADGRYVGFHSQASDLVSGDTNGVGDVFVRDLYTNSIVRASISTNGVQGDTASATLSISADGRYITFDSTSTTLVSGHSGSVQDVFLRDLSVAGVQQLAGMVVSDAGSSRVTLDLADRYQEEISLYRANIGALLSRAESMVSTLKTSDERYTASSATILDADMALESAKLVSGKLLQNASAAVLAQANSQPALLLSLIQ